jgi:hypothetical protein
MTRVSGMVRFLGRLEFKVRVMDLGYYFLNWPCASDLGVIYSWVWLEFTVRVMDLGYYFLTWPCASDLDVIYTWVWLEFIVRVMALGYCLLSWPCASDYIRMHFMSMARTQLQRRLFLTTVHTWLLVSEAGLLFVSIFHQVLLESKAILRLAFCEL